MFPRNFEATSTNFKPDLNTVNTGNNKHKFHKRYKCQK